MLYGTPATNISNADSLSERSIKSFLQLIESRLGVSVIHQARRDLPELQQPLRLAKLLHNSRILADFGRYGDGPDMPRLHYWYAICNEETRHQTAGASWNSSSDALYAALIEALERNIWMTKTDYFLKPVTATEKEIATRGKHIPLARIAGFSREQRATPGRDLRDESRFLWIRGESLHGGSVYLPAQLASRVHGTSIRRTSEEPLLRQPTTNGLATWTTKSGARLRGALELIERDAYMITWLNQLTPPRVSLSWLARLYPELRSILATCTRYQLHPHILLLPTDAPTYTLMALVEDKYGAAPRFSVGLNAHFSLPTAIKKALTEALRAYRGCRIWLNDHTWNQSTAVDTIGHRERVYYWSLPKHAKRLEFLINAPESEPEVGPWTSDTEEEHLARIVTWCRAAEYEFASVSLGQSRANPTPYHIEMTVIPELQPAYLMEQFRAFSSPRLKDIPRAFGYTPRPSPFIDAPHPFS